MNPQKTKSFRPTVGSSQPTHTWFVPNDGLRAPTRPDDQMHSKAARDAGSHRVRLLPWVCGLVVACFATRLNLMTRSLYRDEAWVVNSVLSPSLQGMFFYEKWLQTSPPLFLLLVRGSVGLFGTSEIALRLVPWLAAALSVVLFARALMRLFPATLAMLGTSLYLTNYWALKYSQQVKQYSTDLLVSSLFFFLLVSHLTNGKRRSTFWALVFAGGFSVFLSYTAVFWFPACLLVVAFATSESAYPETAEFRTLGNRFADGATLFLVYAACFGVADKIFIRPNRSASLVQFWISDFIGSGGLFPSLFGFFRNACDLMLPQLFHWSTILSYTCGGAILIALFRALAAQLKGDKPGKIVLVVTTLPVITAVVASYFREYPLLTKPRMIIWLLPICSLLLVYAIEPLWIWLTAKAGIRASAPLTAAVTALIGLVAVGLSFFVVERGRSNPLDDFRSGVLYLSRRSGPNDRVFVYALGAEELNYYSQRLHWHPGSVFVGDTNLGCCLPGAPPVLEDDRRRLGLEKDVHSFMQSAIGTTSWFLLQSGIHQELIVEHARSESRAAGCRDVVTSKFESTALLGFDCASPVAKSGLK